MDSHSGVKAAQLTLPLYGHTGCRLDNFVNRPDSHTLETLRQFIATSDDTGLFLYGSAGAGKTHLLLGLTGTVGYDVANYLSLQQLSAYPPEVVLEGLENKKLVCFDDLHQVAGQPHWEAALFHFFNACQQSGCKILFSSARNPAQSGVLLADLLSRLSWGLVVRLDELPDEQKKQVVLRRAAERGIALSVEVLHYLFSRSNRDMNTLMSLLDKLDRESLTEKRHVTIPFIKKIMQW
jgi:DnaA family protein